MKKVVITGVTGFIGTALAKRLLQNGVKVYGVGRNIEKLNKMKKWGNFIPVVANFEDYKRLHELIDDRNFDMFWHLAWYGTSALAPAYKDYNAQIQNIEVACDAATAAFRLNCSNSSSSGSYQQFNVNINSDKGMFNPVMYAITKKCASDLFKAISYQHGMPCKNIIFPNTFGEEDKLNTAIVLFIRRLLNNEPINLISGDYLDDWMYIEDLVDGILCAASSEKKYVDYYIGHSNITTFKEKLTEMKLILSSKSELIFGTYPEVYRVDYSQFDLNALYQDTGYKPKTSFSESILKTAEWIKNLN